MPEHPYRWAILAGCWLNYFVFGLSITGLAPLVGEIMPQLHVSAAEMGTILGAWQFVYIFVAIPLGLALHRFGPGRMLVLGAAIIAGSGFLRAEAHSYVGLLAAVALFGLGGPMLSAGIPQTIGRWFSGPERGLAMGVYITGPALAGIIAYASTHALLLPAHGRRLAGGVTGMGVVCGRRGVGLGADLAGRAPGAGGPGDDGIAVGNRNRLRPRRGA